MKKIFLLITTKKVALLKPWLGLIQFPSVAFDLEVLKVSSKFQKNHFCWSSKISTFVDIKERERRHRVRTVRLTGWPPSGGGRPGRRLTRGQQTTGTWKYSSQQNLQYFFYFSLIFLFFWVESFDEVVLKESIIEPFLSTFNDVKWCHNQLKPFNTH